MARPSSTQGAVAAAVVRVTALWVLTVALIKLFKGSPSDLPMMVQDFIGSMDLGLKFQLVVAIELSVVFLALLRPRWAWPLLVGMFALFVGMLATMISQGVKSCGCFGGAVKITPTTMIAIDGACLVALLAVRPWKHLAATPVRWVLLIPALAVAWIAPFVCFENRQVAPEPPAVQPGVAWHLPEKLPAWQGLNPGKEGASWIGKSLKETPLGTLLDVDLYPQDAIWILYRITCEHCAKEFQDICNDPERAAKLYVLVHIPEPDEEKFRQVNQLPPINVEAPLPPLVRGYVGQTPWMMDVEGGVVKTAKPGFE